MPEALPPTPNKASIVRFARSCPLLRGLSAEVLEPLAEQLQLRRYEDGARLLDHPSIASSARQPSPMLQIIAHGHATWEPIGTGEKRGAWMLMPGSVFGLDAVNDWARRKQLPGAWSITEPSVRSRAMGPVWTLELARDRFDDAFGVTGGPLSNRLLATFPTVVHAPAIVAALRELPEFSRVSSVALYRMLEHARTVSFGPPLDLDLGAVQVDLDAIVDELDAVEGISPESIKRQRRLVGEDRALYYVLDGTLRIETDDEILFIGPGALGGPDVFRHATHKLAGPTAVVETHAVVIDGRALFEMVRSAPGFGRTLGPHLDPVNDLEGNP